MSTTVSITSITTVSWNSEKNLEVATNKDSNTLGSKNASISESTTYRVHRQRVTVSPSTTTADIDLTSCNDPHSDSITFATVREVLIINTSTTAADTVLIGGAGAGNNAWGYPFNGDQDAKLTLEPSGDWHVRSPVDLYTVDASNKVLRIAHDGVGANHIDVDVFVLGTI